MYTHTHKYAHKCASKERTTRNHIFYSIGVEIYHLEFIIFRLLSSIPLQSCYFLLHSMGPQVHMATDSFLHVVLGIWTQFLRFLLQVFLITHWEIFLAPKNLLSCINCVISFWQSLLVRVNGLTCEEIYQDASRDRWFNKWVGVLSIIRHPFITIVH